MIRQTRNSDLFGRRSGNHRPYCQMTPQLPVRPAETRATVADAINAGTAACSDVSAFIDRLCSTQAEMVAPFEFESLFGCAARVFEHIEQHPSACISPGVVGALVDPRAYAQDNELIGMLATDRATTAFKTAQVACAVHEHSLADDDEFLLLPRYGGNYYLVPVRSVWCAGQTLVSPQTGPAEAARQIDQSKTRVLTAYALELGTCWRPAHDEATAVALGWGPIGALSLVRGRDTDSLASVERREYAEHQSVIVSGASAPTIAHSLIRRRVSSKSARKVSRRATAYVLLSDNYDALFAPRRTRI